MKKLLLFSLLVLCSCIVSFAQQRKAFYDTPYDSRNSGSFSRTTGIISLGYGFPNDPVGGYNYVNGANGTSKVSFGPLYAKYEHGIIRDEIGLGGQIAFSNTWVKYNNTVNHYKDNVAAFSFGMLGYYHFNKLIPVARLDVYVGSGLSIRTLSYTYDSDFDNSGRNNHSDTNVYVIGKVGARYYLKPNFGIYAEAGMDKMSDLNLGVSFKL